MTAGPAGQPFREMVGFVNQNVTVTLTDQFHKGPPVKVTGRLMRLADDGEVVIVDFLGVTHYCWPALHIEPYEGDTP